MGTFHRELLSALSGSLGVSLGGYLFLSSISIIGSSNTLQALLGTALVIISLLFAGWLNSRSIQRSLLALVTSLLVGLPLAYLVLSPLSRIFWTNLTPFSEISKYGSFEIIWFVFGLVLPIEIITGIGKSKSHIPWLLAGSLTTLAGVVLFELLSIRLGQSNRIFMWKFVIYIVWGWVVVVVGANLPGVSGRGPQKGT